FGQGPYPNSNPLGSLTVQGFGNSAFTGTNDLNLTLQTLTLSNYSSSTMTLASTLVGNYAFANSATIQSIGSGGTTTISAPIAIGTTAGNLNLTGSGMSAIT